MKKVNGENNFLILLVYYLTCDLNTHQKGPRGRSKPLSKYSSFLLVVDCFIMHQKSSSNNVHDVLKIIKGIWYWKETGYSGPYLSPIDICPKHHGEVTSSKYCTSRLAGPANLCRSNVSINESPGGRRKQLLSRDRHKNFICS